MNSHVQFGSVPKKLSLFRDEICVLQVLNTKMVCNLPKLELLDQDDKPRIDLSARGIQNSEFELVKFQFKPFFSIAI